LGLVVVRCRHAFKNHVHKLQSGLSTLPCTGASFRLGLCPRLSRVEAMIVKPASCLIPFFASLFDVRSVPRSALNNTTVVNGGIANDPRLIIISTFPERGTNRYGHGRIFNVSRSINDGGRIILDVTTSERASEGASAAASSQSRRNAKFDPARGDRRGWKNKPYQRQTHSLGEPRRIAEREARLRLFLRP